VGDYVFRNQSKIFAQKGAVERKPAKKEKALKGKKKCAHVIGERVAGKGGDAMRILKRKRPWASL